MNQRCKAALTVVAFLHAAIMYLHHCTATNEALLREMSNATVPCVIMMMVVLMLTMTLKMMTMALATRG